MEIFYRKVFLYDNSAIIHHTKRHNNPFAQLSDKCAIWADD